MQEEHKWVSDYICFRCGYAYVRPRIELDQKAMCPKCLMFNTPWRTSSIVSFKLCVNLVIVSIFSVQWTYLHISKYILGSSKSEFQTIVHSSEVKKTLVSQKSADDR